MIKAMLMFALAILGGAAWAAELVIPYSFDGKTGNTEYAYEYQVKMPDTTLTSFTTTIRYAGGNHRVEILSVKLLDGETEYTAVATGTEGTEVADAGSYSGGNNYHNIFTFTNGEGFTANKVYTLQANLKVNNDGAPSHNGKIKVSGGITLYVPPYSFGVNFTTSGNENISTTEGAGFSKGTYAKPTNWGNFTGSASGNGSMTVENQTIKVYWTAHKGMWNSGADTSTDDGKLLYGYLDDSVYGGRTKATVTITGLPSDKQYAVALILSGDADNDGFNGKYSPALINGETYSYVDGALVSGDAAKAATTWGSRRKPSENGPTTPTEGQNVMFVEGLSGSILTITSAMDAWNTSRLTIAGVQVWTTEDTAVVTTPEDNEVISLNFYSSQGSVSGAAGLVSAQGWENLGANGTETTLAVWNGEKATDLPISLTYSSENGYQYTDGVTDNYIKGYLDDGGNQAQVTVENIPFEEYSVIVYAATDTADRKFKPVLINGSYYAGASVPTVYGYADLVLEGEQNLRIWGGSRNAVAAYGTNALRVDGLTASTLTIKGGSNGDGARGCIAALQIVNTGTGVRVFDWTGKESSKISDLGDVAGTAVILMLSAGAELNFDSGFDCESLEIYSDGAITVDSTAEIAFDPKLIVNADITVSSETIRFNDIEIKSGKTLIVSDKNVVGDNLSNAGVLKYSCKLESLEGVKISNKTGFEDLTYSVQTVNFPGTLVIDEGDVVSFNGSNNQRLSMPIEISGGELNLSSGNAGFWLGANGCQINQRGGTVKMLGANTQMSGNGAGLLLGWMGNGPTYNLSGGLFDVQFSHINLWNTTMINISGGELKTLGFIACNGVKNSEISLSGGGKLTLLGAQGVSDVLSVLNLRGGELSVKETCPVAVPVVVEGGSAVVSVDGGKVLTVSGAVSGDGDFVKTGSGILAFTGTLSEYSGTITLKAGKIKMPIDSGFAGEIVTDDPNMIVAKTVEDGVYVYKLSNTGFSIIVR